MLTEQLQAELAHLLRRVDELHAKVDKLSQPAPSSELSPADMAVLERFLPAVARGIGAQGRVFTTRDALDFIEVDDPPAHAFVCQSLQGDVARRLGRLLRRAAACERVADYRIRQFDEKAQGAVMWEVTKGSFGEF
jgi:hypothetical protein